MQKKMIYILAVVLLMTAFFVGCGKKEEAVPELKDTAAKTQADGTDTEKPQATPEKTEETAADAPGQTDPVVGLVYSGGGLETELVKHAVMSLMAVSSIQIDVNIQEASSDSGAAEFEALSQYGCNLIFTVGLDERYALEAARKYPEIYFEIYGGTKKEDLPNVSLFNSRFYQQQYLNGMIAGFISESGSIGYIAPNAQNTDIRRVNAFALGAMAANADAMVHFAWTGDAASNDETLNSLIQKGCDVIMQCPSEGDDIIAADDSGVTVMSGSMEGALPILKPIMSDYVFPQVQGIYMKSYNANDEVSGWFAIGNRELNLEAYSMLDDEQKDMLRDAATKMAEGTWDVFEGPILDVYGQVIIPEGMQIPDEDLLYMLWYVGNIDAMPPPMG